MPIATLNVATGVCSRRDAVRVPGMMRRTIENVTIPKTFVLRTLHASRPSVKSVRVKIMK